MAKHVWRFDSDVASNGYIVNIPTISNLTASLIGNDGSLSDQAPTETVQQVTLNRWMGISINIPDILAAQSKYELLKFYAEKMGYGLGLIVEQDLLGDYGSASTTVGSSTTDLTDATIRSAVNNLDNARAPRTDRHLIVHPNELNALYGIDKFVRYDSVSYPKGESPIYNGDLGMLYGVEVHVSPEVFSVSNIHKNLMWHKEAFALAMQKDIKVEKFARTNFSDRMGASELYGQAVVRTDHVVLLQSL
jgi:N4-gp56 family major capsid protein